MTDDSQLQDLQNNNPNALADLIRTEAPAIYNLFLRLTQNKSDAEDLVNEVFLQARAEMRTLRSAQNVSSWLFQLSVRSWKNWIRHEKTRRRARQFSIWKKKKEGVPEEKDLSKHDHYQIPDAWTHLDASHQQLLKALDQLDPEEKTILILRDMENKTNEEIAKLTNLGLGTVKSHLSRAREHLRTQTHRMSGHIL